jgi:hypothetical protein
MPERIKALLAPLWPTLDFIGLCATPLAIFLNLAAWLEEHNVNMVLTLIISFLSVIYIATNIYLNIVKIKSHHKQEKP